MQIVGNDLAGNRALAERLLDRMRRVPGAVDLRADGYDALFLDAVLTGVLPPMVAPVQRVAFPKGGLYAGVWESTPGKVQVSYDEWEFCHIISGEVRLNKEGSRNGWTFKKGDAFIIPAGFKGTWETVKKLKKHYVILMPKS